MKLRVSLQRELSRLFVHSIKTGGKVICRQVTTNATRTTRSALRGLEVARTVTVTDCPLTKEIFGVDGWNVEITEVGRAYLESLLVETA